MDSRRIRNLRNSIDKNIVDKQVDKIFETGRQFVDGVSGARPGKRKNSDFQGITSKSVKKVGRWVSEKVDLFFDEDNNDWNDENFYDDNSDIKTFSRELKYIGNCQNCGEKFFYRKRIKNIARKKCCVNFFNGSWNKKCLILFD